MKKIDFNDPKLEGIKEFLRMILISIIPVVLVQLEQDTLDIRTIWLAVIISALRGIDKALYVAKSENPVTSVLKLESIK